VFGIIISPINLEMPFKVYVLGLFWKKKNKFKVYRDFFIGDVSFLNHPLIQG